LEENVRTKHLVTNDTTPHVYGKAMLAGLSRSHKYEFLELLSPSWVKKGLVSEQNFTNHMGVRINPIPAGYTCPQVQDRWIGRGGAHN